MVSSLVKNPLFSFDFVSRGDSLDRSRNVYEIEWAHPVEPEVMAVDVVEDIVEALEASSANAELR